MIRSDFTSDCESLVPKLNSIYSAFEQYDDHWVSIKQIARLEQLLYAEDALTREQKRILEPMQGDGRQFGHNVRGAIESYSDALQIPDLISFISELDTIVESATHEFESLKKVKIVLDAGNIPGISFFLQIHDLFLEQVNTILRVIPVVINEFKRTEQYKRETNSNASIMNQSSIINYGNMVLTTGNGNQVSVTIGQNDKGAFVDRLEKSGLDNDSVQELVGLIESERSNVRDGSLTTNINRGIHKLTEKAIDGTWSIPFGIAGNFLYDLIKSYLGIP